MTTLTYEAPTLTVDESITDNEVPWAAAVAALLPVSAAFVVFVCNQCPGHCTSLVRTYETVRDWIFTTQGCA
ncbi:hypothetical protein [Nesterenkonia haasae]|uniref:hypothetical protein n=1 Tax=Nesterenkonia haasae TaxID=2587813 RepID=UPI0013919ECC|nr:hypothetical protein [Nesterenkonia haasae]NDK32455.1 hypothetical protein [Nesterenkonia haasae]